VDKDLRQVAIDLWLHRRGSTALDRRDVRVGVRNGVQGHRLDRNRGRLHLRRSRRRFGAACQQAKRKTRADTRYARSYGEKTGAEKFRGDEQLQLLYVLFYG
jgi:hypothetical protein